MDKKNYRWLLLESQGNTKWEKKYNSGQLLLSYNEKNKWKYQCDTSI